MSRLIRHAIDRVLGTLVSAEDVRRGFRDVEVLGKDGKRHSVRVSAQAPELARKILTRYAGSENPRDCIRPFVAAQFAGDTFLNSLTPPSLARLSETAVALTLGPEGIRDLLAKQLEDAP